jgi:hypothetical protein
MKEQRKTKPRSKATGEGFRKPARTGDRPPPRTGDRPPPRGGDRPPPRYARKPSGEASTYGDPYQRAERPARSVRPARDFSERGPRTESRGGRSDRGEHAERGGRSFTVTLDPDVARVFRGDASVNKALRLVLQLMQVVQGPPRTARSGESYERPRTTRGYQGSAEARGFTRKPRFAEEEESE